MKLTSERAIGGRDMTDEEKQKLEEARRNYQAELDRWTEWLRNEARRLHRQLDPYNWGHWN